MLKKIAALAASMVIISGGVISAAEVESNVPGITFTVVEKKPDTRPVSMKEFFTQYCNEVGYGIPDVFRQIPLRIPGVKREDALYSALQKCVYLGFILNNSTKYQWNNPITSKFVNVFVSRTLKIDPDVNEDNEFLDRNAFVALIDSLPNYKTLMSIGSSSRWGTNGNYQSPIIRAQGFDIMSQIYNMLKNDYWNADKVVDKALIEGAIRGMTDAVEDIHTQYFPPTEAQEFNDSLNGNFEGIGGYLDMIRPGEVIVTSVLKDAPAQKAGLQPNDRITKVDEYVITEKDALDSIIARIKGPAGTTVKLTIMRGGVSQVISVVRQKITVSLLDYTLRNNVPVISIHTFGWGIASTWAETLKKNQTAIQHAGKIIIDLRNNPGGSLGDVADMLSDFVEKDQPVVVTRSRYEEETIVSAGRKTIDFSKIKVVILINGATASASEIMAGTIKDYLPNTVIVGETSYGKGSVQYLQPLADNSSFKITIAHWYTGKTKKAIEGIGIKPDIEVALDLNQLKQGYDTQLEAAMRQ